MEQNIELAKPRDFGEVLGDTFVFIRQNLKPLLKYFFIFCGFFMVATAATSIVVELRAVNLATSFDPNDFANENVFTRIMPLIGGYVLLMVFYILQSVTLNVMILSYMALYQQKRNVVPTVEEMWGYIKYYYLRVLGSSFLLYLLAFVGLCFCLAPGLYLGTVFALVPAIIVVENASFSYAFSHAFKLISNNWWTTFGVLVVIYIILYVVNLVVGIPASILGAGNVFLHLTQRSVGAVSVPLVIIMNVIKAFVFFFQILLVSAVGLIYFNLSETKEGTSLIARIDEFGTKDQDPGPQPEEY